MRISTRKKKPNSRPSYAAHTYNKIAPIVVIAAIIFSALVIFVAVTMYHQEGNTVLHIPTTTVMYTGTGFSPNQLRVASGTRVIFQNERDVAMRVVSDPHPSHSDYPEFAASQDYLTGNEYTFVFTREGTFSYHDENDPTKRGYVHVGDASGTVRNIDKTKSRQQGVRDKLIAMFDPNDPNSIFTVVDTIQADPVLSLDCHDVAHDLGHRAYELYGFSEAMTFANPNHVKHALVQYICAGGYMHGILEEISLHQPEFTAQPDVICNEIPDADRASCFHGIGHVMMISYHRDTTKSLNGCRIIHTANDRYRCFEGVWMETFWGSADNGGGESLGWDLSKPLEPCINTEKDAKPTCYLYSSFGYLRTHLKDYSGAVAMCTESNLPESDAEFCLKGLGITMMSKFKGQHLEGSEVYVEGLPQNQKRAFYEGVLGYARLSGVSQDSLLASCAAFVTDKDICEDVRHNYK